MKITLDITNKFRTVVNHEHFFDRAPMLPVLFLDFPSENGISTGLCEFAQSAPGQAKSSPVAHRLSAKRAIQLDSRSVPVKASPFKAPIATLDNIVFRLQKSSCSISSLIFSFFAFNSLIYSSPSHVISRANNYHIKKVDICKVANMSCAIFICIL